MLVITLGKLVVRMYDFIIGLAVNNKPFPQDEYLEKYRRLESHTDNIRNEFLALQKTMISPVSEVFESQKQIADAKTWESFMLTLFGYGIDEHLEACPVTAGLIRDERISSAMFSVLKAGQRLKPHKGIFKGVVRCHLGLIVPGQENGDCYITVGGKSYAWKEGEVVFLDDTFEHEAVNNSDSDRVVLFLDILRPLPWPLRLLNRLFFRLLANSFFIQDVFKEIGKDHHITVSKIELDF